MTEDLLELEPPAASVHRLIVVDGGASPVFRPNDLRTIRAITGRSMVAMIDDDDNDADRFSAMAFFQLRREEPDTLASILWAQLEYADIVVETPKVDPTSGDGSNPSPLSVPSIQ
jgi:hypothetical protein